MISRIPEPFCPICGRPDSKLITQREAAHDDPFPSPREADQTVYVFKCRCGVTFIHTVEHKRAEQLTS
jgi:hypothetical protein